MSLKIKFNYKHVINELTDIANKEDADPKRKEYLLKCIENFKIEQKISDTKIWVPAYLTRSDSTGTKASYSPRKV